MQNITSPSINNNWQSLINEEYKKPYIQALLKFISDEKAQKKTIFPKENEVFRSLELTPPEEVKIFILGQDPYHGDGQAHGLAFSVQKGVRIPPSLRNIYKEVEDDLGIAPPPHGFLEGWAEQGVLLLNTVLTVERGEAASHQGKGWETFTDTIIKHINHNAAPTVFMLWGSHAQRKAAFLDNSKHLILKAPHPSPLSAHRGFLGCKHFSQANTFLKQTGRREIDWKLPDF